VNWDRTPVLFQEGNPRELKGFDLRSFRGRNFSLNPFKRSTALQPFSQFRPIYFEDGGQVVRCLSWRRRLFEVSINGIHLDADRQFIFISIVIVPASVPMEFEHDAAGQPFDRAVPFSAPEAETSSPQ